MDYKAECESSLRRRVNEELHNSLVEAWSSSGTVKHATFCSETYNRDWRLLGCNPIIDSLPRA
jgi:hypothetical protein